MNVLMTADTVGGVWSYALELTRALAPHGIEVTLATMGRRASREQRAEAASLPNARLVDSEFKLEWMAEPWDDVARAGDWLMELAGSTGADLVHLSGYAHAVLPWDIPVLVVAHSDVLSWWEAVKREPLPSTWDRYADAVAGGLSAADLVVAPTFAMLAALERCYGALDAWRVILNGRDPAAYPPETKEPYILATGRLWDEAKNIDALERVAPAIGWQVRVAGETRSPSGEALRTRTLHCLGRLSGRGLAAQLAHASIFCHPARYEPFGLSVLEAAHACCALVLGDIPNLRELWDGVAEFVHPDDDEGLIETIESLRADPVRRIRIGRCARARARHLTPQRQAAEYREVYATLLGDGRLAGGQAIARERRAREAIACAS